MYGIEGKLYQWLASFLEGRTQSVIVDGFISYSSIVLSGVPQGTVLGPILFLLFINDKELAVSHYKIKCFADDSRFFKSIQTSRDAELLQDDLNEVIVWARQNNMSLNSNKFELLQYHSSSRNFNALIELPFVLSENCYLADELTILPSSQVTDLGVTMQNEFNFKIHISGIVTKTRNKVSWILYVFKSRSESTIMTSFKSLVRPILEYSCILWNPSRITEIPVALLEGVQRTVTSIKIDISADMNYYERLKELNLMSLQRRRERYVLIYLFKILHHTVPNDVGIIFYENHRLGIKSRIPPLPPFRAQLSAFDHSFCVNGPKLWNLLPKSINNISSFFLFKQELDKFIARYPEHPLVNGYSTINNYSLLSWV